MSKMKRLPMPLVFIVSFMVVYLIVNHFIARNDWIESHHKHFVRRSAQLPYLAEVSSDFLKARADMHELVDHVERLTHLRLIDFWVISHGEEVYKTNLKPEEKGYLEFLNDLNGRVRAEERYHYTSLPIDGGFVLILGVRYNIDEYLGQTFRSKRDQIGLNLLGVFAVALFTFIYFFRDIKLAILRFTSRKSRTRISEFEPRSKEAEVLFEGVSAYEDLARRLADERDRLSLQLLPSFRTEMSSGRTPPYDFHCTLVRTDINNFSVMNSKMPLERFNSIVNEFFIDVGHVVSRYNGLIHEFVGDEVLFYFKDELKDESADTDAVVVNSPGIALSAIRDIVEVARRYDEILVRDWGLNFTVKSSFAHGPMLYQESVRRFSFFGLPLIETVRVLSQITEKGESVAVFDGRHLAKVEAMSRASSYKTVQLKGFDDPKHLFKYRGHKDLSEILSSKDLETLEHLTFYRADEELARIIDWMQSQMHLRNFTAVSKVTGILRRAQVTDSNGRPQRALLEWLEVLIRDVKSGHPDRNETAKILASALRLTENLVPLSEFSSDFERVLAQATKLSDSRVVANTVEVLKHFRNLHRQVLPQFIQNDDNRVSANALIYEGSGELGRDVIRRIKSMLSSREERFVASALFAMGEIADFHLKEDPVYFRTQTSFTALFRRIPELVISGTPMIRRQALIAASKYADADVFDEIKERVTSHGSGPLKDEVEQFLPELFKDPQDKQSA